MAIGKSGKVPNENLGASLNRALIELQDDTPERDIVVPLVWASGDPNDVLGARLFFVVVDSQIAIALDGTLA